MRLSRINASSLLFLTFALICITLVTLAGCGSTESTNSSPTLLPLSGVTPTGVESHIGTEVKVTGGSYTNLKPAELNAMLGHKDFILVDVHTPHEGRLPQTDGRIPYDQVEQNIAAFPADKKSKIVLSCQTGSMSTEASKTLVRLGYTNVYNLDGGMNAWRSAGYELIPEGK